jgi:hypothetical protein
MPVTQLTLHMVTVQHASKHATKQQTHTQCGELWSETLRQQYHQQKQQAIYTTRDQYSEFIDGQYVERQGKMHQAVHGYRTRPSHTNEDLFLNGGCVFGTLEPNQTLKSE